MPEERRVERLRRTTIWLTAVAAALVLLPLAWRWLSPPAWPWSFQTIVGAGLGVGAVYFLAFLVALAVRVLTTTGFDSPQELEEFAIEDHPEPSPPTTPRPPRHHDRQDPGLWDRLDREVKSLPDIPAGSTSDFARQHQQLIAQVKARQNQSDAAEDKADDKERVAEQRRLAEERRLAVFSDVSDRLLAIGNLWLVRQRFQRFVRWLSSAGLLAVLMTVASVLVISSALARAGEPRAQGAAAISSPTAVLFVASSEDQHKRLFGRDCPPVGVRGVAVAGSPDAPEVVTYGTEQCRARRIRLDQGVGVAVPLGTATPAAGSAIAESSRPSGGSGVSNSSVGSWSGMGTGSGVGTPSQVASAGVSRVGAVVGMARGSADVLADLATNAGEEAITTAAQVRQFAIDQAAGPFTKTLSEGLAKGLADKANSLWGTNRQAKENAVDRARTEVHQQLTVELDNGLARDRLATLISEDQRTAIAVAIADELTDRLAAQMQARIRTQSSNSEPFTG
jgi:hypothetical protein